MVRWSWPRWIAHRAGGRAAPENTLAGVLAARACGFEAIEIDVRLSADGVPMVIHDDTLLRTAGVDLRVDALPAGALRAVRVDHGWVGPAAGAVTMPDLDSLLTLATDQRLRVNIELKPGSEAAGALAHAVVDCLAGHTQAGRPPEVLVSSFVAQELHALRQRSPLLPIALLSERMDAEAVATAGQLDAVALNLDWKVCTPAAVQAAQDAGLAVCAWTVNDGVTAERLFALGVAAIFTDCLDLAAYPRAP